MKLSVTVETAKKTGELRQIDAARLDRRQFDALSAILGSPGRASKQDISIVEELLEKNAPKDG
jgi:hypothetical protein